MSHKKSILSFISDKCDIAYCKNNGQCRRDYFKDDAPTCSCPQNTSGLQCEKVKASSSKVGK